MANDPLGPLQAHPVIRLADWVAAYTGVEGNLVQMMEFLSLAGGRMGCPLHLDVRSEHLAADLYLANRILELAGEAVARVDTFGQFRQLEQQGLGRLHTLVVQANDRSLFRQITERLCRGPVGATWPSVWRIDDQGAALPGPAALCLMTPEVTRDLSSFSAAFSTAPTDGVSLGAGRDLVAFLGRLPSRPAARCPFRDCFQDRISPERALIVERILQVFAAARAALSDERVGSVSTDDYKAARALLRALPLTRTERAIPPAAVAAADVLYARSKDPAHQLSLPDRSREGSGWFTREDAHQWTGLAYNTVKKHLQHLEEDGLIVSTITETNRERGKKIYFRFAATACPPFALGNPFESMLEIPASLTTG